VRRENGIKWGGKGSSTILLYFRPIPAPNVNPGFLFHRNRAWGEPSRLTRGGGLLRFLEIQKSARWKKLQENQTGVFGKAKFEQKDGQQKMSTTKKFKLSKT